MRTLPILALMIAAVSLVSRTFAQPTPTFNDVIYATAPTDAGGTINLPMDIYKPTGATAATPVVIWIHGGGWQGGTYNTPPLQVAALLARGISVASVEYRLSGTSIFPAQINDVKGAVRYLRANAATYALDMNRVSAWGTSAGGHLSALLATSGDVATLEGNTGGNLGFSSRIFSAVDYFGPTDLLNMNPDVTNPPGSTLDHDSPNSPESHLIGFDNPGEGVGVLRANQNNPAAPYPELMSLITSTSSIAHLSPDDPAVFIAHGLSDTTVPSKQSQRLFDAMNAAKLNASLTLVPGAGHGNLGTATDTAAIDFLASQLLPVANMSNWNNPFGGAFSAASNWHGGALPTASSDLMFNFNANYNVTVNSPTIIRSLSVGRGNVELRLTSTLQLNGSLSVGRSTGPRGTLIVNGGTLVAGNAFIGGTNTGTSGLGSLVLDNAARVQIANNLRVWSTGVMELREHSDALLRTANLINSGTIDLADNAMVLTNTSIAAIDAQIRNARHAGAWDQPGITSSTARDDVAGATTLGAITGAQFLGTDRTAFHGHAVAASDVLIEHTRYGDADLNGIVNFDDYARIDSGFNNATGGWFNGDFDQNGAINFDDYALIDLAFNSQAPGALRTVPEPTVGAMLGPGCIVGALRARRARRAARSAAKIC